MTDRFPLPEGCVLSTIVPEEAPAFYRFTCAPGVRRWLPDWEMTEKSFSDILRRTAETNELPYPEIPHLWGLYHRQEPVGIFTLAPSAEIEYRPSVGFFIAPEYQRQGMGSAGLELLLRKARQWDIPQLFAMAEEENSPSCRLLEKQGFEMREERLLRPAGFTEKRKFRIYEIILKGGK